MNLASSIRMPVALLVIVYTDHRLGRNLEIGDNWLHWVQPHAWAEVSGYGLEVTRGPRQEEAYWLAATRSARGRWMSSRS